MGLADRLKKIGEHIDIRTSQVEKNNERIEKLKSELIETILNSKNIKKDLDNIGKISEEIKHIDNFISVLYSEINELKSEIEIILKET